MDADTLTTVQGTINQTALEFDFTVASMLIDEKKSKATIYLVVSPNMSPGEAILKIGGFQRMVGPALSKASIHVVHVMVTNQNL